MIVQHDSFKSTDGIHSIACTLYSPMEDKPKGVIQFCHGMAEHRKRYERVGRYFAENGWIFCICDHLGHGESINNESELGYFGKKDGYRFLAADAARCTALLKKKYPDLFFCIGGHSMGSFVVRHYLARFPNLADAAIIMGGGSSTPLIATGKNITALTALIKGGGYRSELLDRLSFGSYNDRIVSPSTKSDWLSRDAAEVKKYIDDPLCGFLFTASGLTDVSKLICEVTTQKWAAALNTETPLLILSGDADPVGGYGSGVIRIKELAESAGVKRVVCKLYPGARHELFNENCRDIVLRDILEWLTENAG